MTFSKNGNKLQHATTAIALVLGVASVAGAATECFLLRPSFPPSGQGTILGECSPSNRTRGFAFYTAAGAKAVRGTKLNGLQTSVVQGVESNNTPITGCRVSLNDPADGEKRDETGCGNAAKWQVRMFDS